MSGGHWVNLVPNFSKCVLKVKVPEANHTYKDGQLCAVLKAVMDGAVHGVQYIWYTNSTDKNWGFLLINANNAVDEINRIGMLWIA